MSNFDQRCSINLIESFLRFEQFGGLAIRLKRISKLKFYLLGILKEVTVRDIMLT